MSHHRAIALLFALHGDRRATSGCENEQRCSFLPPHWSTKGPTNMETSIDDTDAETQIRSALKSCLSPKSLRYFDGLIARVDDAFSNPRAPRDDVDPADIGAAQVDLVASVREFLEDQLSPEQMELLTALVSEMDRGPPDDDPREDYAEAVQARQGGAGMGQKEDTGMYAQDELKLLRGRLKAAGIPIGDQPNLHALRHLARNHPNMRGGMALDQARSRPDLSLSRMFPSIAARFAKSGPGSFAVRPDAERQRSAASGRAMAYDSGPALTRGYLSSECFPGSATFGTGPVERRPRSRAGCLVHGWPARPRPRRSSLCRGRVSSRGTRERLSRVARSPSPPSLSGGSGHASGRLAAR